MIDLYYWPTPNGHKITIFLEEAKLPYKIIPVNIREGEQFKPDFLRLSPNNKMPAIVDHVKQGESIALFESGAILLYLADKIGQFIQSDLPGRANTLQWLFWQVAGLGPMAGQTHHFTQYAPEVVPYAINRYVNETARLYAVLNRQLNQHEYIVGAYSIVDMACYPWVKLYDKQQQNITDFPHIERWLKLMDKREAVQRAYAIAESFNQSTEMTDAARKILFSQGAHTVVDDKKTV